MAYHERAAAKTGLGKQIAIWRYRLDQNWQALRFGSVSVKTDFDQHRFELEVYLGELEPSDVAVELYAEASGENDLLQQSMSNTRKSGAAGFFVFTASVPAARPVDHYTARLRPCHAGVSVPLEAPHILWQR